MKYEHFVQLKEILQCADELKEFTVTVDPENDAVIEISIGYFKSKKNMESIIDALKLKEDTNKCCDPGFYKPVPNFDMEKYAEKTKQVPIEEDKPKEQYKPEWLYKPGLFTVQNPVITPPASKTIDPIPDPNVISISSTITLNENDAAITADTATGVAHLVDRV